MAWAIITFYISKCAQMNPKELLKTSKFYSRCKKCDIEKNLRGWVPTPLVARRLSRLNRHILYYSTSCPTRSRTGKTSPSLPFCVWLHVCVLVYVFVCVWLRACVLLRLYGCATEAACTCRPTLHVCFETHFKNLGF